MSKKYLKHWILSVILVLGLLGGVLLPAVPVKATDFWTELRAGRAVNFCGMQLYVNSTNNGRIQNYFITHPDTKQSVRGEYVNNLNSKEIRLKGGVFKGDVYSYVDGLTIYVEKDTTILDGTLFLYGNTTIKGPGKLTITPSKAKNYLYLGIYVVDDSTLTLENLKLDVTTRNRGFREECWAITGDCGNEKLIIRDSIVHAIGSTAAICDFNGGLYVYGSIIAQATVKKNGSLYGANGELAKEITISDFYFTRQPDSEVTAAVGETVRLTVDASKPNATYQWQRYNRDRSRWENVNLTGAQSKTLTFVASEDMYSWRFRCVVTYGSETMTSYDANLKVVAKITSQPGSAVVVNAGSTATLSVTAEGSVTNYTWQYYDRGNWVNLTEGGNFSNVRTRTLTVKGNADTQGKIFRCAVRNRFGYTTYTNSTTLSVRNLR